MPAVFKQVIDEKYGQQFYITSRDGAIAEIYPLKEWEEIEAKLRKNLNSPAVKKFVKNTSYYGLVVEMDGQGRLTLPARLREKANLVGDVAIVGAVSMLQVRVLETFRDEVENNPCTDEDDQQLSTLLQ